MPTAETSSSQPAASGANFAILIFMVPPHHARLAASPRTAGHNRAEQDAALKRAERRGILSRNRGSEFANRRNQPGPQSAFFDIPHPVIRASELRSYAELEPTKPAGTLPKAKEELA